MAILSANSRRSSSTPTSPSSPRPSIGNGNIPNETARSLMQSLNEEEVVSKPIPLPPPPPPEPKMISLNPIGFSNYTNESVEKISKEKNCTERSDSGFSDCSNSSNGNTILAAHIPTNVAMVHPLFDKINSISEEKSMNEPNQCGNSSNKVKELGSKVSVNMLKMKLEKMADAQQETSKIFNSNKKMVKRLSTPFTVVATNIIEDVLDEEKSCNELMRTSYSFNLDDVDSLREFDDEPKSLPITQATKTLMRSSSLHQKRIVEKEPIMKSDFTNTIKMRKKSLESNAAREKQIHPQRILLEPSGKVSKLLRRFDSQNTTANGFYIDTTSVTEPIVQTPGIDDTIKEMTLSESNKADDEIIEILGTNNATELVSVAQKSPTSIAATVARKSPTKIVKTIVSSGSGSMKRVIASKQSANTKTHITSMEMKVTSQRKSPTKLTNDASNTPINRATPKAINNQMKHSNTLKKSHNKSSASTADPGSVSIIQRASRNASATTTTTTTTTSTTATTNKATAYSSFNRTSPVRLSGRVREVTDRLSTTKAIVKATSPVRDRSDKKSMGKYKMVHEFNQEHHQNMAMKSISGKIVTVSEAIIETEQHIEHTINGKIDGTFTLKSKMNENFRKASAFWKAT